jgi:hypothetical protein
MTIDISVCGLIVIPGREPQGWECGLYWEQLTELDLSVALNFTRERVRNEAITAGYPRCSFIVAAFHPGKVPQCSEIIYADTPVNPDEENEHHANWFSNYTVCGFYSDNWQTYSGVHQAISPRMAYFAAWEQERIRNNRYLYVANVHENRASRLCVPGSDTPPIWGDPACVTEEEMTSAMTEILSQGCDDE